MSACKYDDVSTPSDANGFESKFAKRFMKEQKLENLKNQVNREPPIVDHTTDDAYL